MRSLVPVAAGSLLLLCFACASKSVRGTVRDYPGDERPASEVAIFHTTEPTLGGARMIGQTFVMSIDGRRAALADPDTPKSVETLPGEHTLEVGYYFLIPFPDGRWGRVSSQQGATVRVNAVAGGEYLVHGELSNSPDGAPPRITAKISPKPPNPSPNPKPK
jgi:hypothetical protein